MFCRGLGLIRYRHAQSWRLPTGSILPPYSWYVDPRSLAASQQRRLCRGPSLDGIFPIQEEQPRSCAIRERMNLYQQLLA